MVLANLHSSSPKASIKVISRQLLDVSVGGSSQSGWQWRSPPHGSWQFAPGSAVLCHWSEMNQLLSKLDKPGLRLHRHKQLQHSHQVMTMVITSWEWKKGIGKKSLSRSQRKTFHYCRFIAVIPDLPVISNSEVMLVHGSAESGDKNHKPHSLLGCCDNPGEKVKKEIAASKSEKSKGSIQSTRKCSVSSLTEAGNR